jgi:hypothetical protein
MTLVAACASPAGPTVAPSANPATTGAGPTLAFTPSPSGNGAAATDPAASLSPVASVTLPPTATPAPTHTPTPTPKPTPSLTLAEWKETPIGMSVAADPIKPGKTQTVTASLSAGPTCSLKVKYADGSSASLPKPTRPDATRWTWKWTIPQGTAPGTATMTIKCTYLGVTRGGPSTFTITGWSISATFPSTLSSSVSTLFGQVTIHGLWQRAPSSEQRLSCLFTLVTAAGTVKAGDNVFWYSDSMGPFDLTLPVGALGPDAIGRATWTLACTNFTPEPDEVRKDSGTIDIT